MTIRGRPWSVATPAAVALALVALSPRQAGAEGRRVLFVTSAPTPFSARVGAEIEAMGFELEPASDLPEGGSTTAVAAARVIDGPGRRIELWIVDTSTGRLSLRAVVPPSSDEDDASQTVRASEQLRAFFRPLRAPSPPLPAPVNPPSAAPPASAAPLLVAPPPLRTAPSCVPALAPGSVPAPRGRFVAGAELGVPFQPGGPGVNLGLRGRWMATKMLGLGGFVSVPVAGSTVTATGGSAAISAVLVGADLAVVAHPLPGLRVSTSAGLALAWVRTSGFAGPSYQGQRSDITAALPMLGAAIAPRLTEWVHLYVDGRFGVSLPRADIAFSGHVVATWGRPLGLVSAGVSVDL